MNGPLFPVVPVLHLVSLAYRVGDKALDTLWATIKEDLMAFPEGSYISNSGVLGYVMRSDDKEMLVENCNKPISTFIVLNRDVSDWLLQAHEDQFSKEEHEPAESELAGSCNT